MLASNHTIANALAEKVLGQRSPYLKMEKFRQLRQKNAVLEVKGAHSPYTRVFWVNLATYKIIFKLREYILKMKQQQDDIDECKEN